MSNNKSSLEEKIQWFLAHPEFLEGTLGKVDKHKAVSAMKRDGLFSKSSWWFDINLGAAIKQAKVRRNK
jgi:hypothetical protein